MSKMTINKYGHQVWKNEVGQLHRVDGPAYIHANKYQVWFIDGLRHRENGPAIIYPNEYQSWFIDGLCHRLDGPAFIQIDGYQEWWINDINLTNQVISWVKDNNFPDHTLWTDTQKIMFRLAFSGTTS